MSSGKVVWKAKEKRGETWFDEIRLAGQGDEPGFFKAFVYEDVVVVHGLYDVLAFRLESGELKWRYAVPFDFEIRHAVINGDLLILAGQAETVALYLGTDDPRGEVVWQEKEEGDLYIAPYFVADRLVEVRKMPCNVTVRYRSTGKLMGRLTLPDLLLHDRHPLLDTGPRALAAAHDGKRLAVTDGWYYVMVDVEAMRVLWKRLIDANDATRLPPMRFELKGDYLAVVKQDYDIKTIYMLASRTGEVLWHTDPKVPSSPQPICSMHIEDGRLYGIGLHPGQGFYFVGLDCRTGKPLFRRGEHKGYRGKPDVALRPQAYGNTLVAMIRDRQDFELRALDVRNGKLLHTVKVKGTGDFGEHGRASATVQDGGLAILGGHDLQIAVKP
jgi:outer membrane protein assembly factor BamB